MRHAEDADQKHHDDGGERDRQQDREYCHLRRSYRPHRAVASPPVAVRRRRLHSSCFETLAEPVLGPASPFETALRASSEFVNLFDFLRSEEHTSELQSLMRISYAVFCFKNKKT